MKKTYLDDNIFYIENFLSKEMNDLLYSQCLYAAEWGGEENWYNSILSIESVD